LHRRENLRWVKKEMMNRKKKRKNGAKIMDGSNSLKVKHDANVGEIKELVTRLQSARDKII